MIARWFHRRGWSDLVIGLPYVWLLIFFLIPFLIVVAMSFGTRTSTAPPLDLAGKTRRSTLQAMRGCSVIRYTSAPLSPR